MSKVNVRSGREGPTHDPYSYKELTVTRPNGAWFTIHSGGLLVWTDSSRQAAKTEYFGDCDHAMAMETFGNLVGVSYASILRALRRRENRCPHCASKGPFKSYAGYPGETVYVCERCGQPGHCDFDRSAIE